MRDKTGNTKPTVGGLLWQAGAWGAMACAVGVLSYRNLMERDAAVRVGEDLSQSNGVAFLGVAYGSFALASARMVAVRLHNAAATAVGVDITDPYHYHTPF
jgi:hypothetical protein